MPPDRDAAQRAMLDTAVRALDALSRDVGDAIDMSREARDATGFHGQQIVDLSKRLEEIYGEQRMTLGRVLVRALDRASEKSPIQTIAAVGTSTAAVAFILLGGAYSLIWHETPAVVIGELFKLLPFVGGP